MNKQERLAHVWSIKDETLTLYRSFEDGLKVKSGYHLGKLKKLLDKNDLTLEDFQQYGLERRKLEERETE